MDTRLYGVFYKTYKSLFKYAVAVLSTYIQLHSCTLTRMVKKFNWKWLFLIAKFLSLSLLFWMKHIFSSFEFFHKRSDRVQNYNIVIDLGDEMICSFSYCCSWMGSLKLSIMTHVWPKLFISKKSTFLEIRLNFLWTKELASHVSLYDSYMPFPIYISYFLFPISYFLITPTEYLDVSRPGRTSGRSMWLSSLLIKHF